MRVNFVTRLSLVMLLAAGFSLASGRAGAGELQLPEERVVYSCGFDFILDLCSMTPDGTDEVQLTDDGVNDHDPEISPDGRRIAWTRDSSQAWVMEMDGSDPHQVRNFGTFVFAPTWSPDGNMLAFGCTAQGQPGICTAKSDGSSDQELVAASQGATQPDWSPDGMRIAFESLAGQTESDIYVVNLANGQVTNLTNTPDQFEHFPRWSPDGTRFAFWSEPSAGEPPQNAWYTADANGSNRERLFAPMFFTPVSSPAWSPDGTAIAVFCDELVGTNREMCVVDAAGGCLDHVVEVSMGHLSEGWSEPSWATTGGTQQGDVDCNGSANSVDALKILRYVAGLGVTHTNPCPEIGDDVGATAPALWGDLDCNGTIDAIDALKALRFVAGLSVTQTEPCWDLGTIVVPV